MMSDSPLGETGNATTAQGIAAVSADQGGVSEGSIGGGGRRQSTVVWLKLLASSVESSMAPSSAVTNTSRTPLRAKDRPS